MDDKGDDKVTACINQRATHLGIVLWWSTFYQRWNWTKYENGAKQDTTVIQGKPILSDVKLIERITKLAERAFPGERGRAKVVESAYSAIWFSDDHDIEHFLTSEIDWLVCHSI